MLYLELKIELMSKNVLSNILIYGKGLVSSRALGLIRDLTIGISLGVGLESDILLVALTIPDFIANVSFGSGAQLALLPFFQKFDKATAIQKLIKIMRVLCLTTLPFAVALIVFQDNILHFFLPAYSYEQTTQFFSRFHTSLLLVISALMLIAVPLRSYLQAHKDFKNLGLENVIFNLFILMGVFTYFLTKNHTLLLSFVLLSFLLRIFWLVWSVQSFLVRHEITVISNTKTTFELPTTQIINSSVFTAALVIIPVIIRSFSTYLGEGWATKFIFANRLVDAALLIFTTIIGSVVFSEIPEMIKSSRAKLMEVFSLIVLYLLPTVGVLGFAATFFILNQISIEHVLYDYLYVLLALSVFIPARLFIHYYNLVLIADGKSAISAATAIIAAIASALIYKTMYNTSNNDPYLIISIQAMLVYPLCIGLLLHLALTSNLKLHWLFAACVYSYFHICYWLPDSYLWTVSLGILLTGAAACYIWSKKHLLKLS